MMVVKKAGIFILLTFYIAVQLKPLTAVVQDVLAHTFFSVQHMATVHYENGRYHIHKELKAINDEENGKTSQKSPTSPKVNEIISHQVPTDLNFNFNTHSITIPTSMLSPANISPGFTRIVVPPPELS